jgi:hypothetical protein
MLGIQVIQVKGQGQGLQDNINASRHRSPGRAGLAISIASDAGRPAAVDSVRAISVEARASALLIRRPRRPRLEARV